MYNDNRKVTKMTSKITSKVYVLKNKNKYKCETISEIFPDAKENNVTEWVGGSSFTNIVEASVSVAVPSLVRNFVRHGAAAEEELQKDLKELDTKMLSKTLSMLQ